MVSIHTITDAKAHLSQLVQKVLAGDDVIIGRAGHPAVRLVKYQEKSTKRKLGALKGKIHISPDFDDLPEDLSEAFGLIQ